MLIPSSTEKPMKFIAPFSCLLSLFLLTLSSTYAQTRQKASTVRIDCKDEYGMAVEEGAGLLVGEDDSFYYGLTAFHVLEVGETHKVQLYQSVNEYEAEILQTVPALDIAFFKFPKEGKSLSGFYVGTWNDMKFGDEVRSVGHPAGEKWSINILNKLIAKEVDFDDRKFSISNQGIMGGCSGGPVFNQEGEWIGLITETGVVEAKGVKSEVLVKMLKSWGDLGNKIVSRKEESTTSLATDRPQTPTSGREERPDKEEFMDMIRVLGGSFSMGSELGRPREEYPHKVELSSFMMGQHEITNAQWRQVMGTTPPSANRSCSNCPVENVSWSLAQRFLTTLNSMYPGKNYRLPTEAEWEYAAKGGQRDLHKLYPGTERYQEIAWLSVNSNGTTQPVKSKKSNTLRIYDLAGNVAEWCQDYYDADYYKSSAGSKNPTGPTNPKYGARTARVVRGGSYRDDSPMGRVFHRYSFGSGKSPAIGFRIARDL